MHTKNVQLNLQRNDLGGRQPSPPNIKTSKFSFDPAMFSSQPVRILFIASPTDPLREDAGDFLE